LAFSACFGVVALPNFTIEFKVNIAYLTDLRIATVILTRATTAPY